VSSMTSRLFVVVLLMAATPFISQQAEAQDQASGYKIGVVDMQTLIADYPKRQRKYDELEQEVRQLQVDIDAMSTRIEQMEAQYEQQRDTMDEQQRLNLQNQITEAYAEYRSELERRQRSIDNKEDTVLSEILGDIENAIARVAQQENFHLILNTARGARGAVVVWSSPTIDITARVQQDLGTG